MEKKPLKRGLEAHQDLNAALYHRRQNYPNAKPNLYYRGLSRKQEVKTNETTCRHVVGKRKKNNRKRQNCKNKGKNCQEEDWGKIVSPCWNNQELNHFVRQIHFSIWLLCIVCLYESQPWSCACNLHKLSWSLNEGKLRISFFSLPFLFLRYGRFNTLGKGWFQLGRTRQWEKS